MKKIAAILLTAILFVTLLAGCSSTSGPSKNQVEGDIRDYLNKERYSSCKIDKIDIEISGVFDEIYEAQVSVDYTEKYNGKTTSEDATLVLEYKYYSNGGWILKNIKSGYLESKYSR